MKRAREYRKCARDTLGNRIFDDKWLYALLAILVYTAVFAGLSAIGFGVLGLIVAGPLAYGLISVFLRIVRKEDEKADIVHVFDGFKEKFGESLLTSLLCTLYIFLWSLLLIIPGIIKSYSYAASLYLLREKNLEYNDAITESRRIMDGNKWGLFCLDLSFIGWYIVGFLCLGIGLCG